MCCVCVQYTPIQMQENQIRRHLTLDPGICWFPWPYFACCVCFVNNRKIAIPKLRVLFIIWMIQPCWKKKKKLFSSLRLYVDHSAAGTALLSILIYVNHYWIDAIKVSYRYSWSPVHEPYSSFRFLIQCHQSLYLFSKICQQDLIYMLS